MLATRLFSRTERITTGRLLSALHFGSKADLSGAFASGLAIFVHPFCCVWARRVAVSRGLAGQIVGVRSRVDRAGLQRLITRLVVVVAVARVFRRGDFPCH